MDLENSNQSRNLLHPFGNPDMHSMTNLGIRYSQCIEFLENVKFKFEIFWAQRMTGNLP